MSGSYGELGVWYHKSILRYEIGAVFISIYLLSGTPEVGFLFVEVCQRWFLLN